MYFAIIFFLALVLGFLLGIKAALHALAAADKKERNRLDVILQHLVLKPKKRCDE